MSNGTTKQEKRAKPRKRRSKLIVTIMILMVLIATNLIQDASKFESMAQEDTSIESGNQVTQEEQQWKEELSNLNLKGDGSIDDILAVAKSQLGYKQRLAESNPEENKNEPKYYSRYGAALNHPYDPWNTTFMAFCLQYAKVRRDAFPVDLECTNWMKALQEKGFFYVQEDRKPTIGNLVFFNKEGKEEKPYVGLIKDIKEEKNITTLHIIVGDYDGKVQEVDYKSTEVIGYGVIPDVTMSNKKAASGVKKKTQVAQSTSQPNIIVSNNETGKSGFKIAGDTKGESPSSTPTTANPTIIPTVDSRSEGIKLNLFDYDGGSGVNLDSDKNSVDHPIYQGINAGRDFLFLGQASSNKINMNTYTGGDSARQGIVKNILSSNGYPTLSIGSQDNLDYLFNPSRTVVGKKTYENVNHLFTKENGYYVFDSNKNYAHYGSNAGNGDFTVYYPTYNAWTPFESNEKIGFFPFNNYDSNKTSVLASDQPVSSWSQGQYNHHFGMTMEFDFQLNEGKMVNGQPMTFEFRGDDDVWVFIDDVLVLDMGGIHGAVGGRINFKNGTTTVDSAVGLNNNTATGPITKSIASLFPKDKPYDDRDWSKHKLKFYYLERGSTFSNNYIKFNLPTGLHIEKKLTGNNAALYADKDYEFQLYVEEAVGSGQYDLYKGSEAYYNNDLTKKVVFDSNGTFKMKAGQTVDIYDINANKKYYLKEVNIDENIIADVKIGTNSLDKLDKDTTIKIYWVKSNAEYVYARPSLCFDNQLREEYKDITIQKKWLKSDDSTMPEITLKLWCKRSDEMETKLLETIKMNTSLGWKQTRHLPVRVGSITFSYSVSEDTVNGYKTSITSQENDNDYIITICNIAVFDLKVVKRWLKPDGSEKTDGILDKVNVTLKRTTTPINTTPVNGTVVEQIELKASSNSDNNWAKTWNDLEAYDEAGKLYYYYVEETPLDNYRTTYDNNVVTVSNRSRQITINNIYKFVDNITLPGTGGSGIIAFTITGLVLMGIVWLFLLLVLLSKRRCK